MATAQVTLKVSPYDLQIVCEALCLYAYVHRHKGEKSVALRGGSFKHDLSIIEGDPRKGVLAANELLRDFGLH